MFAKKYTARSIMEGVLNCDLKTYKYLDANFRWKTINYVRKNSGTKEDGEELYNDVLCSIYLNIKKGSYDPDKGTFQSYFMQIAHHRWNDCLRKRKQMERTVELNEQTDYADVKEDADMYMTLVQAMKKHLHCLKKNEQELIKLFYYEKKSIEMVAQQLDMSGDYVKLKLYRTREKLKKKIHEDPEFRHL